MPTIASIIPGASYAAGAFTIPWTAISAITTNDTVAVDSFEALVHGLVMCLFEKQNAGTITQVNSGLEVSSVSQSVGVVETSANTFSDRLLFSALLTWDCGATLTPILVDGDTLVTR
jgi:hypothetical protein